MDTSWHLALCGRSALALILLFPVSVAAQSQHCGHDFASTSYKEFMKPLETMSHEYFIGTSDDKSNRFVGVYRNGSCQ